jgi:hypothetical protein
MESASPVDRAFLPAGLVNASSLKPTIVLRSDCASCRTSHCLEPTTCISESGKLAEPFREPNQAFDYYKGYCP